MKLKFILIIFFVTVAKQISAQTISGKVMDEHNRSLSSASVILLDKQDSSYIYGVATNTEGEFLIPLKTNKEYILQVSFIGYKTIYKTCTAGKIDPITMREDANALEGTQITASRIKQDAQGYTISLKSSELIKGKQTSDVLMFLPGVTKEDGSYKINGLAVSDIYVDGVKLPSLDELDNIPADMLDKAKVNFLAGSDQNAALAGGRIELFLRRPPRGGFYGSATGGLTLYPSYGFNNEKIGGVLYGQYKKLSIYNNLSLDFSQPEETAKQTIWQKTENVYEQTDESIVYHGHTIRNRFSLSAPLNTTNTISGSYYIATNKLNTNSQSRLRDDLNLSDIHRKNTYLDQEVTLKNTTVLKPNGMMLECVGDYFNRHSDSNTNYCYNNASPATSEDRSSLNMYKFSMDLTDSRNPKHIWKYGASIQYITSKYTPTTKYLDSQTHFQTSQTSTRTSGWSPIVYFSTMGQLWKMMYSVGANFQTNRISYKILSDGTTSSSTQWGINPTVQLMMPFGKNGKHALMIHYKRTLEDIPYAAISSVIEWSDAHNYTTGNPALKSPSTDIVMAGASLFHNTLNFTALYAHAKNSIYWETQESTTSADVFYTTPVNLPGRDSYGAGVEINWDPTKAWKMKLSGRIEIHPEDMTLGGVYYGKTRVRQYYTMYNSFNFSHGWGGMVNAIFEPTYKTYDRTYYRVYNIGGQIYKSACKNKLQFTLIFNALGNRRKYDRYTNGSLVTYNNTTSVQSIGISVTWRFSGGKSANVNAIEDATQEFKEIIDVR